MARLSEHDQAHGDRLHEWDEMLLAEEWRDSIDPDDVFRGWHRLDTIAQRCEEFERDAGRTSRLAEYQRIAGQRRRRLVQA